MTTTLNSFKDIFYSEKLTEQQALEILSFMMDQENFKYKYCTFFSEGNNKKHQYINFAANSGSQIIDHGSCLWWPLRPLSLIAAAASAIIRLPNKDSAIMAIKEFGQWGTIEFFLHNEQIDDLLIKNSKASNVIRQNEVTSFDQNSILIRYNGEEDPDSMGFYFGILAGQDTNIELRQILEKNNITIAEDPRNSIDYSKLLDQLVLMLTANSSEEFDTDHYISILDKLEDSYNEQLENIANEAMHMPKVGGLFGATQQEYQESVTNLKVLVEQYKSTP